MTKYRVIHIPTGEINITSTRRKLFWWVIDETCHKCQCKHLVCTTCPWNADLLDKRPSEDIKAQYLIEEITNV